MVFRSGVYSVTSISWYMPSLSLPLMSGFESVVAMLVVRFKMDGHGYLYCEQCDICLLRPAEQAKFTSSHQFCSSKRFELRQNNCIT
jgi:hypothetical protein